MPACRGAPLVHPAKLTPRAASAELWLAVTFHAGSATSGRGSDDSNSESVHGEVRFDVAVRTFATSDGVTTQVLPKPLRTYDATAAIHSSVFVPIGTITSA